MPDRRTTRRSFLALGAAGIAAGATSAAGNEHPEKPDGQEMESILDAMDGEGSEANPYAVTDLRELQSIEWEPESHYVLGADIDASATETWSEGFSSITGFAGSLHGDGHRIRNFTAEIADVRRPTELVWALRGGTIRDVRFENVDVTGERHGGVIVRQLYAGTIRNVSVDGTIRGGESAGAIVGTLDLGSEQVRILGCSADCSVVATDAAGGLVGAVHGGPGREDNIEIRGCVTTGDVESEGTAGGLIGYIRDVRSSTASPALQHSVSTATVETTSDWGDAGGAVGSLRDADMRNCAASGAVRGAPGSYAGGLIGSARTGNVERCYATGPVRAGSFGGGLVGWADVANVRECFATGPVWGGTAGGLFGWGTAEAENVFSTGAVHGCECAGGLIGKFDDGHPESGEHRLPQRGFAAGRVQGQGRTGGIVGCIQGEGTGELYWDEDATGQQTSPGVDEQYGIESAAMRGPAAVEAMPMLDFEDVWTTQPDEYPHLQNVGGTYGLELRDVSVTTAGDVRATLRVENRGDTERSEPVRLSVDGTQIEAAPLRRLEPGETATVRLTGTPLSNHEGRVTVSVTVASATTETAVELPDQGTSDSVNDTHEPPTSFEAYCEPRTDEDTAETQSDRDTSSGSPGNGSPGLGFLGGVAGIAGGAAIVRRRLGGSDD